MRSSDGAVAPAEAPDRWKLQFPSAVTTLTIVTVVWVAALSLPAGSYRHAPDGSPMPSPRPVLCCCVCRRSRDRQGRVRHVPAFRLAAAPCAVRRVNRHRRDRRSASVSRPTSVTAQADGAVLAQVSGHERCGPERRGPSSTDPTQGDGSRPDDRELDALPSPGGVPYLAVARIDAHVVRIATSEEENQIALPDL